MIHDLCISEYCCELPQFMVHISLFLLQSCLSESIFLLPTSPHDLSCTARLLIMSQVILAIITSLGTGTSEGSALSSLLPTQILGGGTSIRCRGKGSSRTLYPPVVSAHEFYKTTYFYTKVLQGMRGNILNINAVRKEHFFA